MKKTSIILMSAVTIVIINLIILIPRINKLITKTQQNNYKKEVQNIIDTATNYVGTNEYKKIYLFEIKNNKINSVFSNDVIDIEKANKKTNGKIKINIDKTLALYVENSKYCAMKKYTDTEINIYDISSDDCILGKHRSNKWDLESAKYNVQRDSSFEIPTPVVKDENGNNITLISSWTITNKTKNEIIGKDLKIVTNEYTHDLDDLFIIDYISKDESNQKEYIGQTIVRVVDTKEPIINNFTLESVTNEYNSNYVNIKLNATDIGTKQNDLKIYITTDLPIEVTEEGWIDYKENLDNYLLKKEMDSKLDDVILQVKDEAGNIAIKSIRYTTYGECMNNVTETSNIDEACSKGKEQYEIYRIDNKTNKKCPILYEKCNKY